ncbi:MAG: hypothetical protein PHE07_01415 [Bacteroidales bacterium]|nr:hypothetical protein [Bacteroidales bacterium]
MSKLGLKCTDDKLKGMIRTKLSKTNWFFAVKDIDGLLLNLFIEEKVIEGYNGEKNLDNLIPKDQFRVNKIISKLFTNGDLIFNVVGRKYYSENGIEVAWAGEKTPISD